MTSRARRCRTPKSTPQTGQLTEQPQSRAIASAVDGASAMTSAELCLALDASPRLRAPAPPLLTQPSPRLG
eukprot:765611-Rhodomonas_salina.1